jgi:hypothetical protein
MKIKLPQTNNGWFDTLMMPVRGIIAPLHDKYRKVTGPTEEMTIPAWAVSDTKNTPIPYTVEHRYDFGNGGVYGPPDFQVSRGVVNVEKTIMRQVNPNPSKVQPQTGNGFYYGPQENIEIFVHAPFSRPTNLPCSTSRFKY